MILSIVDVQLYAFIEHIGLNFHTYILTCRMQKCKALHGYVEIMYI